MASLGTMGSVCRCGKHHWHNYRYRHRRQKAVGLRSILVGRSAHAPARLHHAARRRDGVAALLFSIKGISIWREASANSLLLNLPGMKGTQVKMIMMFLLCVQIAKEELARTASISVIPNFLKSQRVKVY
jgi:hypothetical protein